MDNRTNTKRCYYCGIDLKSNGSIEHIYPAAIGCHRTSKSLLCKKHNSEFGASIDSRFSELFDTYIVLFGIKRDRGNARRIKAKQRDSNHEVFIDSKGDIRYARAYTDVTKRNDKEVDFSILASDRKHIKQALTGLKRQYPKLDIEKHLEDYEATKRSPDSDLYFHSKFASPESFPSAVKSMINFALESSVRLDDLEQAINYIKGNNDDLPVTKFYSSEFRLNKTAEVISNSIAIICSKNKRLIVGIAEFMNAYRYIAVLNNNYDGENTSHIFADDALTQKSLSAILDIDYDQVDKLVSAAWEYNPSQEIEEFKTLSAQAISNMNIRLISQNAIDCALKECEAYPDSDFISVVSRNLTKHLHRQSLPFGLERNT